MAVNYIDPVRFQQEMTAFVDQCAQANVLGEERPPVSEYLGDCFVKIAYNLARVGNWSQYPYKDEMISDGIENCFLRAHNYKTEKGHPFPYFTQLTYYAFVHRIKKEKGQDSARYRMILAMNLESTIVEMQEDNDAQSVQLMSFLKKQVDLAQQDAQKTALPKHLRRKPKYIMEREREAAKKDLDRLLDDE